MQVNGKTCFNKKLAAPTGKQLCGQKHGGWNEQKIKVTCTAPAVNGQFTVRVYTQLNSAANDESFGIDNVVLRKVWSQKVDFEDTKDFEGFNCVKITSCGSLGNICGGFNTKGKSHDIKKTFTKLPAGTYTISLDFIKIDSWFDWLDFGGVCQSWNSRCLGSCQVECCVCVCVVRTRARVFANVLHTTGITRLRSCK